MIVGPKTYFIDTHLKQASGCYFKVHYSKDGIKGLRFCQMKTENVVEGRADLISEHFYYWDLGTIGFGPLNI